MRLNRTSILVAVCGLSTFAGCSHLSENHAIDAFTRALADGDVEELRESTSDDFAGKALRSAEAMDSLTVLKLPTGDTSIVDVEEVSADEKNVKVRVGDSKRVLLYKLTKDRSRDWVVDDVYVRQSRRGHTDTRSVTEQMDLLLSVREFLDAWDGGTRNDVLAVATPMLGRVLGELPPGYLANLVNRVAGEHDAERKVKPEAQLDGDMALVSLPRSSGKLVLKYRQTPKGWKVNDLAVESRKQAESVPSVLKLATATLAGVEFLNAYNDGDKAALANVSVPEFHRRVLAPADLSTVSLPMGDTPTPGFEIRLQGHRADFVLPSGADVVKLALTREKTPTVRESAPVYRVEEASIFDGDGSAERRLSAVFTANASMMVFADALNRRDLSLLRQSATNDFNERVWDRLTSVGLEDFPIVDVDKATPQIKSTVFNGGVVEVTVTQGERAMTYVLRQRNSELRVDDVLVPAKGHPTSLKTTLALLVPVHQFAIGVQTADVTLLQRSSSTDFNRLVWNQTRKLSPRAFVAGRHLHESPSLVLPDESGAVVLLGSERFGARITLVEERGIAVVDEILLIAGPGPEERAELKRTLRGEIGTELASTKPGVRRSAATVPPPVRRMRPRDGGPIRRVSAKAAVPTPEPDRLPPPNDFPSPDLLPDEYGDMPIR